jgi:spore coat protein JA
LFTQVKEWHPFIGPHDPCRPITVKTYSTPPQLYIPFQPMNLPQFSPLEALKLGTLWPALYSPYEAKQT